MFVDEITIYAKAGDGGDGVVRWRHEKFKPKAGPAGGNGGRGGDVRVYAVKDLGMLSKYVGKKAFYAEDGEPGRSKSQYGRDGEDLVIALPVGAIVVDLERGRTHRLETPEETLTILRGGSGGLGNEHFKSSTNRTPRQSTKGTKGEYGTFRIELELVADVGLIGMPNAGKSTLLNTLTNAKSAVGAYAFTTLEPHLGTLYGFVLADIPGLIEGASTGKGLGHKFLRHIRRTNMLLHLISLENDDPQNAYRIIRRELSAFDPALLQKEEWIVLTKSDTVDTKRAVRADETLGEQVKTIYTVSAKTGEGIKELQDALIKRLRKEVEAA